MLIVACILVINLLMYCIPFIFSVMFSIVVFDNSQTEFTRWVFTILISGLGFVVTHTGITSSFVNWWNKWEPTFIKYITSHLK